MTTPINPANQIVLDPAYTYRVSDLIAAGKLHPHPDYPTRAISEPLGWRQRLKQPREWVLIHDSQNSADPAFWPPIKEPEHFFDEYNAQQAAAQAAGEEEKATNEGEPLAYDTQIVDPLHQGVTTLKSDAQAHATQSLEDAAKPWREAIGRRVLCCRVNKVNFAGSLDKDIKEFTVSQVSPLGYVSIESVMYTSATGWEDPRTIELLEVLPIVE